MTRLLGMKGAYHPKLRSAALKILTILTETKMGVGITDALSVLQLTPQFARSNCWTGCFGNGDADAALPIRKDQLPRFILATIPISSRRTRATEERRRERCLNR
jgi:hypothetical protein